MSADRVGEHARSSSLSWLPPGLVLLMGAHAAFTFPAHHDMAWLLHMSARALDGARLYVDVVDPNPPLIVALGMPAELISRVTGLWDVAVFRVFVLVLVSTSLWITRALLGALGGLRPLPRDLLLVMCAGALVLLDSMQFGQRDHLALVLVLPWVAATACRATGRDLAPGLAVSAGVMGALGLCLKPHYAGTWLLLEIYLALTVHRRPRAMETRARPGATLWRLEHRTLLTVVAAYGAAVLLLTPAYLDAAGLAARTYLGYAGTDRWALLVHLPVTRTVGLAVLLALLLPSASTPVARLRLAAALAAIGFLVAIIAQGKGWLYHWVPANGFALVAVSAALVDAGTWLAGRVGVSAVLSRVRVSARVLGTAPWLLALAFLPRTAQQLDAAAGERLHITVAANRFPELLDVVERLGGEGPVGALSSNVETAFPLLNYADLGWSLRFASLWMMPALYAADWQPARPVYRAPAHMSADELYVFRAVIEDLVASGPTLLIVDRRPRYGLAGFDFLAYFAQDAAFAAWLAHYHPVAVVERYLILARTTSVATNDGVAGACGNRTHRPGCQPGPRRF